MPDQRLPLLPVPKATSGKRRSETRRGKGVGMCYRVAPRPVQIIRPVRSNHGFLSGSFPPSLSRGHRNGKHGRDDDRDTVGPA